jgi:Cu(I)/Ag(I) efflux system membrane fusion protein
MPPARDHAGHGDHAAPPDAEVTIDAARRRQVGIATAPVTRGSFEHVVRATGRVVPEESGLVDVSLKVRGWVQELRADAIGVAVTRGDVLLTLYSPELYAAQEEYLQTLRSRRAARETSAGDRVDGLAAAARTRLRLWGVSDADLAALERRGRAFEALPIRSPATGFVIEKEVVQGAAVEPGVRILRIAPSDRVWVEAQIDEREQGLVAVGLPARVSFPGDVAGPREATVQFVEPTLDPATRTARMRLALPNPGGTLRPGAFADVTLRVPRGERLLVPVSAVLYAGPRRLVFVDVGGDRLRPREVTLGLSNGELVEVLSGVEAGQQVVVSGNFLVAAESRLRAALEAW